MKKNRKFLQPILHFVQGALVGTGAILPGISGGVLCVAFGFYETLMELFSHPIRTFRKHYRLFLPLLAGGAVGFVLLAKVVELFFAAAAAAAIALFAGLICGTVPGMMQKTTGGEEGKKGWGPFIITLAAAFVLFNVLESSMGGTVTPNFGWYIFCGAIWGLSLVVPGLSSSSLLIFMGLYEPMAGGIGNLDPMVIIPLLLGFLAVLLLCSRIMVRLLKNHYVVTSRVIMGFMIASVLMILPTSFTDIWQLLLSIVCFAAGFLVAVWMDRIQAKQETEEPQADGE